MTRIMMRMGLVGLTCCCLASVGGAVPIEVNLVPIDNSAGGAELEGFTTTDIVLTIPGTHTGSQLFIELERGTIYSDSTTVSAGTGVIRFGELRLAAEVPEPAAVNLVTSVSAAGLVVLGLRRVLPRRKTRSRNA